MSKGQTNIQGIYPMWREGNNWDALRIAIRQPNKPQMMISSKIYPPLRLINDILKKKKIKKEDAFSDPEIEHFFDRLCQDLKAEYALPYYRILEKLELKRKGFNFEESLNEFETYKSRHSISHAYRVFVEKFWLPFFISKSCEHPRDFINFQSDAEFHLRTIKNKFGKLYSPASYNNKTTPLNEYMRYLLKKKVITPDQFFTLDYRLTLEERKRQTYIPVRTTDTYSMEELKKIKIRIDQTYDDRESLPWKLRAYGLYLGSFCMGLRVGNILGLPVSNLKPDDEIPHAQLKDNIVNGWSRGLSGDLKIENATKTSHDNNIKLPFVLPSIDICKDVVGFLKSHLKAMDPLLDCSTGVPSRWWKRIARECKFRYIHPHGGKHGYATIGAANLHLFKNNPYLLQYCCLHKDFRTTQKYINQKSDEVLKQFK